MKTLALLMFGVLGLVFALGLVAGAEMEGAAPSWSAIALLAGSLAAIIAAVEIRVAAARRRCRIEARLLGRVLAVAGIALLAAGCATYDPRPARVYMPPSQQTAAGQPAATVRQEGFPPSYLREIVAGKSVTINAPDEFRGAAIDYFRANSPMSQGTIEGEVDRYIAVPGQALAYMIGRLEILRMRAEAEKKLGKKFDIKGFHDTVLGSGLVPLSTLDRMVKEWAAA